MVVDGGLIEFIDIKVAEVGDSDVVAVFCGNSEQVCAEGG